MRQVKQGTGIVPTMLMNIWVFLKGNILKDGDIPNWLVLIFTTLLWPLLIWIYDHWAVGSITNLEVALFQTSMNIGNNETFKTFDAVEFQFLNKTDTIVYITNAKLKKCSKHFPVPREATKDIASSSHELKFLNTDNQKFEEHQITLQTNGMAKTAIALRSIHKELLDYHPSFWKKFWPWPKFFKLEYIVMVNKKRYKVVTKY